MLAGWIEFDANAVGRMSLEKPGKDGHLQHFLNKINLAQTIDNFNSRMGSFDN